MLRSDIYTNVQVLPMCGRKHRNLKLCYIKACQTYLRKLSRAEGMVSLKPYTRLWQFPLGDEG